MDGSLSTDDPNGLGKESSSNTAPEQLKRVPFGKMVLICLVPPFQPKEIDKKSLCFFINKLKQ
jgi:hypothetical protein